MVIVFFGEDKKRAFLGELGFLCKKFVLSMIFHDSAKLLTVLFPFLLIFCLILLDKLRPNVL